MTLKIMYYYQDDCCEQQPHTEIESFYNTVHYKNKEAFTIDPNETVIVLLSNCGQHNLLNHSLMGEIAYDETAETYHVIEQPPFLQYRLCIKLTNSFPPVNQRKKITFFVQEGTALSILLKQPELSKEVGLMRINYSGHPRLPTPPPPPPPFPLPPSPPLPSLLPKPFEWDEEAEAEAFYNFVCHESNIETNIDFDDNNDSDDNDDLPMWRII